VAVNYLIVVVAINLVRDLYRLIECCLNWRVIAGLALAAAALFALAPKVALVSLPVLVALVCPISMLVMLVSMGRMKMGDRGAQESEQANRRGLSREGQLQLLEDRLLEIQQRQREIALQLPDFERRPEEPMVPVVAAIGGRVDSAG